jgi:hypothetical protein
MTKVRSKEKGRPHYKATRSGNTAPKRQVRKYDVVTQFII